MASCCYLCPGFNLVSRAICFVVVVVVIAVGRTRAAAAQDDDLSFLERYNITREEYEFWKNATNFNGTFPPNLNGSVADKDDQYGYGYGYGGYGYPSYPGYAYAGYPAYPSYNYPGYPANSGGYGAGYPAANSPPQQFPAASSPTYSPPPQPPANDPDSAPANINDGIANKECYYKDTKGMDFRGFEHVTNSGKQCLYWASTSYNKKTNPLDGLDENFCRNPSGSNKPWCYVSGYKKNWWGKSTTRKWEYCDVPTCDDILVSPKSQFTRRACIGLDVKGNIYTAYQDEPMRLPKTNCICKWGSWYCGAQQTEKPCTGIDTNKNLYVVYNQRGMKIGNTDCMCNNGIWFCDPVSTYNNDRR